MYWVIPSFISLILTARWFKIVFVVIASSIVGGFSFCWATERKKETMDSGDRTQMSCDFRMILIWKEMKTCFQGY